MFRGESPDSLMKKIDSLSHVESPKKAYHYDSVPITVGGYFSLTGSDMKQAFTKPFHSTKKEWITFGKFALVEALFHLLMNPVQRFSPRPQKS